MLHRGGNDVMVSSSFRIIAVPQTVWFKCIEIESEVDALGVLAQELSCVYYSNKMIYY